MEKEMIGKTCDISMQKPMLPEDYTIAMAYVPFQQWDSNLYGTDNAFSTGTLFPDLDKPFTGKRGVLK